MSAEVHLPMVGGVSRKALMIGGGAAVAVVGLVYLRKRKAGAASPAAASSSGQGQVTGYDSSGNPIYDNGSGTYTDPGLQDTTSGPTYGQTGYYDPNSGQWVYGSSGTGQAQATTNAAWAQLAEQYLTTNNAADPGALSSALGKYLTGQAVTPAEESLIDQAIAIEGYPPVGGFGGYPPGIRTQAAGGQTPPPAPTGGGGVTRYNAPGGLHVTNQNPGEVSFAWTPVSPVPDSYTLAIYGSKGNLVRQLTVSGPGGTVTPISKGIYTARVWANGGKQAPPGANLSFKITR